MTIARKILEFGGDRTAALVEETIPGPGSGQLLVESEWSAISAGTELLVYRGELPEELALDDTLSTLATSSSYPVRYGYSLVGRVTRVGEGLDRSWIGRRVFCFDAHADRVVVSAADAILLPDDIRPVAATMLPSAETAVSFLLDGAPLIGERIALFGLGVVGTFTAMLLSRMSPERLFAYEPSGFRRRLVAALVPEARCAHPREARPEQASAPSASDRPSDGGDARDRYPGFDLVYELSGRPETLGESLAVLAYDGRLVIGSWYGTKRAAPDLGGRFHRARPRIISSQVSTIAPHLTGRWDRTRRRICALEQLRRFPAQELITHRVPFEDASDAYRRLEQDEERMQIVMEYRR